MGPSIVRTVVPLVVAFVIAQAARIGLNLPEGATTEIVTGVVFFLYYAVARWIEQHYPRIGRWLLSLGLTKQQPVYVPPARTVARSG